MPDLICREDGEECGICNESTVVSFCFVKGEKIGLLLRENFFCIIVPPYFCFVHWGGGPRE